MLARARTRFVSLLLICRWAVLLGVGLGHEVHGALSGVCGLVRLDAQREVHKQGYTLGTNFDPLGLASATTGNLINATYTNTFDATQGWTSSVSQNNHTLTSQVSPKGDPLGTSGYGVPDTNLSAPSYGSNVTRTLSTPATPAIPSAQFTYNLAGTLARRQFPDGSAESIDRDGNGAPTTWKTPRTSFDLSPNLFGQPTQIGSMGTLGYDLAGRVNTVANAADTATQTYVEGQPDVETHTAGPLQGQRVDRDYNSLGQLESVKLPGGKSIRYTYGGTGGALGGVTTAGGTLGTWSNFDPTTGQARSLALGALSTVSTWDGLGRNTGQTSTATGTPVSYTHHYDADGHCDSATAPEGTWTYGFDATTGWIHTAARPGQSFTYNFDEAGGSSGHATDFRPTARLNSALVTIFGTVAPAATINVQGGNLPTGGTAPTVNSTNGQFSLSLAAVPAGWQTFTTQATLAGAGFNGTNAVAEAVRQIFVPPATEILGYDASGNRGSDARWTQTWNALDQMTVMVESNPASAATAARLDLFYDLQGRRVEKQVSVGGAVTKVTTTLWDGWKPVMEIDYTGGWMEVARRYYSWGPDVSGSFDGAAGIGGLLEILEIHGSASTRSLPIYDGVGNVVGLVDAESGERVATYQYGPFGETLGVFGVRAASCPFRFQTKLYDDETGLSYFGKRYYDSKTQTWLSRDPLREGGGVNLYAYCGNDPVNRHDPLGLAWGDTALIDGGWTPLGDPYSDPAGNVMVKMRHVIALTLNGRMNVASDSVMSLAEGRRLAPYSSVWRQPMGTPQPTLLAGTGFQGVDFADISSYIENHPGFNMQMGVLESAPFALGGGYMFGGIRAVIGARAAGYLGSGLLGMSLGEWAKNDFAVNPRTAGQMLGGLPAGGAFLAEGEAHGAAGMRFLSDTFAPQRLPLGGGMLRNPRLAEAGSIINPFTELFGGSSNTTRLGVTRNNPADWRATRDLWDELGYSEILSATNRARIAAGRTPHVDDEWIAIFLEDAGLLGERIPMHHVEGLPLTIPLPASRHLDSHMPGGFRYNPGDVGSALPIYPFGF